MNILKGLKVSEAFKEQIRIDLKKLGNVIPTLAIVRVGENPDDISYEKSAIKKLESFGLQVQTYTYPADIEEHIFLDAFTNINTSPSIHGILLLRPLPKHISEHSVIQMIDPKKDVDGISPTNMAKVFAGDRDGFAPCTAMAVLELLNAYEIPLKGKNIVVLGRSLVVGKPVSMLLLAEDATVTICHTKTRDIKTYCKRADIIIAAAGVSQMVDETYVSEGSVLIDVGINFIDGKLVGDVKFSSIEDIASAASPVPGGIGMVTTAVLAKNLVKACFLASVC